MNERVVWIKEQRLEWTNSAGRRTKHSMLPLGPMTSHVSLKDEYSMGWIRLVAIR